MSSDVEGKIRKYWAEFLPSKVLDLVLEGPGVLDQAIAAKAAMTADWIDKLVESGCQYHEAEEIAFAEMVYSEKPELHGEYDEQDQELAEKERYYQQHIAPLLTLHKDDDEENEG